MAEVVVEQFVQTLVGTELTDEKEVRSEVEDPPAQGLAEVQVVAEEDRPIGAQFVDVGGQPAFGGVALAVLLALFLGQFGPLGGRSCWGWMNSGISGMTRLWLSATTVAESMVWKYCSVLCLPTWRMQHCSQRMESEEPLTHYQQYELDYVNGFPKKWPEVRTSILSTKSRRIGC